MEIYQSIQAKKHEVYDVQNELEILIENIAESKDMEIEGNPSFSRVKLADSDKYSVTVSAKLIPKGVFH